MSTIMLYAVVFALLATLILDAIGRLTLGRLAVVGLLATVLVFPSIIKL